MEGRIPTLNTFLAIFRELELKIRGGIKMQIEVRPLGNGLFSITPEEKYAHAIKEILEKELDCEILLFLERATGRAVGTPSQAALQTIQYISYLEVRPPEPTMTTQQIASQICERLQGDLSHSGDNFYITIR
jgi:hypothetical protein